MPTSIFDEIDAAAKTAPSKRSLFDEIDEAAKPVAAPRTHIDWGDDAGPITSGQGDFGAGFELPAGEMAPVPYQDHAVEKLTTPLVHLPRVPDLSNGPQPDTTFTSGEVYLSPAQAAGAYNVLAGAGESLTSPASLGIMAATAGTGALAKAGSAVAKGALGAVGVGFGGVMAKDAIEQAKHAREVLENPDATEQQKVEAVAAPVVSGAMSLAALAGVGRMAAGEAIPRLNKAYPEIFWKKTGLDAEQFAATYPSAVRRVAANQGSPADIELVRSVNDAAKASGVSKGDLARGRIVAENVEWEPRAVQKIIPESLKPEMPEAKIGFRKAGAAPVAEPTPEPAEAQIAPAAPLSLEAAIDEAASAVAGTPAVLPPRVTAAEPTVPAAAPTPIAPETNPPSATTEPTTAENVSREEIGNRPGASISDRAAGVYKEILDRAPAGGPAQWYEQMRELMETPERYHHIGEDKNPAGLKIGDLVTVGQGERPVDKPWQGRVVSILKDKTPVRPSGFDVTLVGVEPGTYGGHVDLGRVTKAEKPAETKTPIAPEPVAVPEPPPAATVKQTKDGATIAPTEREDVRVSKLVDKKQFKVQREYLLDAAKKALAVAPESATDYITFEVPGDGTFKVFNNQARLKAFVEIIGKRFGKSFTLPAELGKSARITVHSPFSEPITGSREAPGPKPVPALRTKPTVEDVTEAVKLAASTDQTRYTLHEVVNDGGFTVATDGRRLYLATGGAGKKLGEDRIVSEKVGAYPNWSQVVPPWIKLDKGKIMVGKDAPKDMFQVLTADGLKTINQAINATGERLNSVFLYKLGEGRIGMSSADPEFGDYRSDGVTEGMKAIASVNPQYLRDSLIAARMTGNDAVKLFIPESKGPVVVIGGNNFVAVTMPTGDRAGDPWQHPDVFAEKPSPARRKERETNIANAKFVAEKNTKATAPAKQPSTSGVGYPLRPQVVPGAPSAIHRGVMPVSMPRTIPGQVEVPTILAAYEAVVASVGGKAPIRARRFYQKALGIYKPWADVIRNREIDDLPTAAHEVAHAVSKQIFGSTKSRDLIANVGAKPVVKELQKLGKALYGSRRPNAGYTAEGFSEFLRLWITTEDAATTAPATSAWFQSKLLPQYPKLAESLARARDLSTLWRYQGAEARAIAQRKDPPGRLARLLATVKRDFGREGHWEEGWPLQNLSQGFAETTGAKLTPANDPFLLFSSVRQMAGKTLQTMVNEGMVDIWGNVTGPSLREAFARLKPKDETKFWSYMHARRAIERWGKDMNPGMTLEDAAWLKQTLETPEFVDAANKYYAWWNGILDYLASAAPKINGPLVRAVKMGSGDYMPLSRVLDPAKVKSAAGGNGRGGGLHHMKGSGLQIVNPGLQTMLTAQSIIARAHKDLVLNSVMQLAQHEGMGWLVEEVPKTRVLEQVNIEKIRHQLEDMGVDTDPIPEDTLIALASHLDKPSGTDPIVQWGDKWYQVPTRVYDLLEGVQHPERLGWVFELLLGGPNRLFKLGTTGLRAGFSAFTNPARDLPTMMLQSVVGNPASRLAGWFQSMGELLRAHLTGKESSAIKLYEDLAISASNYLGGDIAHAQREASALFHGRWWSRIHSPLEEIRELFSLPESAPRLTEMRLLAKELGWKPGQKLTPNQAVALRVAARRVTVDFTAGGKVAKQVNRAIPFYNPAIQGTRSLARAFGKDQGFREKSSKDILKTILGALTMLTLPALYSYWHNKDKQWFKILPWRERYLYLNVEGDDGRLYQIPTPMEWGAMFMVIPQGLMDAWHTRDPEGLKQALKHVFEVSNPIDYPVLAKAAKEQWQNRIDFFDRPIVPKNQIELMPGAQRSFTSSILAKALGNAFPETVSPRRVDAALRSLFGGVATDALNAPEVLMRAVGIPVNDREPEGADLPIIGRLFRRGGQVTANNRVLAEYFDDLQRYGAWKASNMPAIKGNIQEAQIAQARGLPMPKPATPPIPMSAADQQYLQRLEAYRDAVHIALEMANKAKPAADETGESQFIARQRLIMAAVNMVGPVLRTRPKTAAPEWHDK